MSTELALYEHAREALASAVSFDEVTKIHTAAAQARAYARIAKDRKLLADAQELIARAERKLGILIRRVKDDGLLSQGGRPAERSNLSEPETGADAEPVFDATPFTLAELGISKKLSMRAQHLAELDETVFEDEVTAARDKTLATDAAVIGKPKTVKVAPAPKPDPIKPLPSDAFHRFTFSVLALTMNSDRVSSEALQKLAEFCRIVVLDGETVDFTPEAYAALGHLAEVALKALDGDEQNTPEGSGTAREACGGSAPESPKADGIAGLQQGTQSAPQPLSDQADAGRRLTVVTENGADGGEGAVGGPSPADLVIQYRRQLALIWVDLGKLSMAQAGDALRAGRTAGVSPAQLAKDLEHPLGTVKTWLNRLGLTDAAHMEQMNADRAAAAQARRAGDA